MFEHQKQKRWAFFETTKSSTEAEETKLMSEDDHDMRAREPKMSPARIHLAVLLVSMFMFVMGTLMVVSTLNHKQSDRSCAAQLSIWSPLFQAVEYEERDWESIFTKKHSDWTGAPTVELEDKWHRLVNVPTVIIPEDRVPALNRSIEQGFVKGGSPGNEGYIAGIEDLTPYLLYDSTGQGAGIAREDFQATHKCKRFEPIFEWVHKNGVVVSAEDLKGGKNHSA
ncbi:hypothetical protein N0V91_006094 [Didymella pomorum]|uniref:Uncharacterized protein n=1 Tax=Didymella pomorum TaxID=749634 RepID=A0A9W8ZDJ3_9PLEO|nr:hypothetical protein N0V91_006094 [Didymella pomorum]